DNVDVRDVYIRHVDVCHVDVSNVGIADAIMRNVGFARTQREPCHAVPDRERKVPIVAANEGHQSRGVNRPRYKSSWNPHPCSLNMGPSAIVKGRKSPGHIIDPCPAPWFDDMA